MATHRWRSDLATAVSISPMNVIRDAFSPLTEIEQVFVFKEGDARLSVLIVVNEKDYDAQKRIFEREADIIDALAGIQISFDVIIRDNRPLRQIITPRGNLLFARP